jgi:hypothetical protein
MAGGGQQPSSLLVTSFRSARRTKSSNDREVELEKYIQEAREIIMVQKSNKQQQQGDDGPPPALDKAEEQLPSSKKKKKGWKTVTHGQALYT